MGDNVKTKKLVLVNPTLSNPFPGFPPLGLGYVAALTPDHWDVEIVDENFEVAFFRDCDLVGITGFTAMANRAYQVAEMFREKNVPVVMGGIHASMMPEEALQFVDAVVIGEVESVWAQVIEDVEAGNLKPRYQGTLTDLNRLVHPRRDLFNDKYFCDTIQTARGCPQDCDFCSVSQFNGFAYRRRPVEEVLDELSTLKRKIVFIVDDNIVGSGSRGEDRAIALAEGMVERKLKLKWYSQAALNAADNDDVLRAFKKSGCLLLFMGIESEDRDVLQAMNKKVNLQRDYKEVFQKIHDHHIGIHGSFILGTDEDTRDSLKRRFDFILDNHIDVVQYCTLTPYPGTRLFKRLLEEDRLLYTNFPADWDRYDLTEILVEPSNLDMGEYRDMMRAFGTEIFSLKSNVKRLFRTWRDTGDLLIAFWCFVANKLYKVPRNDSGQASEKFWYLSSESWPFKKLVNPETQIHRQRYLSRSN
jgi:radical SAM superfamily enzyme YgiQ (UPF0313 family)